MNGTLRKYGRKLEYAFRSNNVPSSQPKIVFRRKINVAANPEIVTSERGLCSSFSGNNVYPSCRNEVQIKMPLLKNNRASDSKFHSLQHCIVQFPIHTYAHARFSARFESAAVFIQGEQGERRGRPKLIPARGRRRRERTAAGQSRIMPVYESVRFERVCFDIVSRLEQLSVACWL